MGKGFAVYMMVTLSCMTLMAQQSVPSDSSSIDRIRRLAAQGKFDDAQAQLRKMPKDFQFGVQGAEINGDIFGGLKKWDSALVYFERFKKMAPNNAAAHFKYGGALGMKALTKNKLSALMYLDDIEAHFKKAVEVDPGYTAAHWALIEYYLQVPSFMGGGVEKALAQADELFEASPIDGWMARARLAEEDEDLKRAEQNYKKAVSEGQSLWTYRGLISFYERQKHWDLAFDQLKKAMAKFDDLSLNYQWAKMSVLSEKNIDQGLNFIVPCVAAEKGVEGIPEQWIRLRYAQLLRLKGQNAEAAKQISRALAIAPDFEQALDEQRALKKNIR
jgi:tetratricopeptide (TPR) repeat protein